MFCASSRGSAGLAGILGLLKARGGGYLSCQDMGGALGMSGAEVRRHVRTMRRAGYKIEARRGSGYRLAGGTDRLLPWEVMDGLDAGRVCRAVHYFDEIGSTQDYALGLAAGGGIPGGAAAGAPAVGGRDPGGPGGGARAGTRAPGGAAGGGAQAHAEGHVVIAERQTGGRGRLQRRWESPRGGIWMSVVARPKLRGAAPSLVPIAVAAALASAIAESAGADARVRWPNDITIGGKKVAGVIIDASVESGLLEYVVVGTGINFDVDAAAIEAALEAGGSASRLGVTSITAHSRGADRLDLVRTFLRGLDGGLARLERRGGAGEAITDWTRMSETPGARVSFAAGGRRITGIAGGIDPDGALTVRTARGEERILAGDVEHR